MFKPALLMIPLLALPPAFAADMGNVRVQPSDIQGPRPLAKATESAVIRDYLEAWQALAQAMQQNRSSLLNQDFAGTARDKLGNTIQEQRTLGIYTRYQNDKHDLKITFYSPEGLSIQLVDHVVYDMQFVVHGQIRTTQQVHARYIVLLTPSEVRWRVRILQAQPD